MHASPLLALLMLLVAADASAQTVICTTPDGTRYAGVNPPPDCVIEKKFGDSQRSAPAFSGGSFGSSDGDKSVRLNCALEWPTDFAMQKYCIDRQVAAATRLNAMMPTIESNKTLSNVLGQCGNEWQGKAGGFDFAMVEYCFKRQAAAYRSLYQ